MSRRLTVLIFVLGMSPVTFAQQNGTPASGKTQTLPEEVVITGGHPVMQLRTQMIHAEKNAYDIFNRFNDEKRFNISCSIRTPTGTRIPTQVCRPKFQIDATSAHARDFLDSMPGRLDGMPGGSVAPVHVPMEMEIARQLPDYRRKIKQVAEQHPEFLEAVMQFSDIRQQYEEATRTIIGK